MNEKINITKSDGATISADIICFLENIKTGKRYAYYTLNETVGAGPSSTVKIYVSKIAQNNPALDTAITEEEWGILKGYMSDALKGNTNPDIKYISLKELASPTSISEKAIAMPTSYDYINKQRGIYAQSIASIEESSEGSAASITPAPEPTVVEETPEPTVAPVAEPAAPVAEPTPAPVQEPVPAPDPITTPAEAPTPVETPVTPPIEEPADNNASNNTGSSATLTPINIEEIEQKYAEMIDTINKLKTQELEAAKRYNATIELSAMHNEQHANYVQNEQSKEVAPNVEQAPIAPTPEPTPVVETPISEPTPVIPTTPVTDANLETNWFDMPAS